MSARSSCRTAQASASRTAGTWVLRPAAFLISSTVAATDARDRSLARNSVMASTC